MAYTLCRLRMNRVLVLRLTLLIPAAWSVRGTDFNFVNPAGGNWSNAANWSPTGVPGLMDTATLGGTGAYTVTLDVDATVVGLNVGGSSGSPTLTIPAHTLRITGTGEIVSGGTLRMTGGTLSGNLTIGLGGRLELSGGGQKVFDRLSLVNRGAVTWNGGGLAATSLGPRSEIVNAGDWEIKSAVNLTYGGGAPFPRFINTGTFRSSSGNGLATVTSWIFENQNQVEVQSGSLFFINAESVIDGLWSTAAGAAIQFQSARYTYTPDASFTGAGDARIGVGGLLVLSGNQPPPNLKLGGGRVQVESGFQGGSITNLTIDGASLEGTNTVSGILTINGGRLAGELTIAAGGRLQFLTSAQKFLDALTLINHGVVSWMGGTLNDGALPSRSRITNTGLWELGFNGAFSYTGPSPYPRFINSGTFRKTAGGGTGLFVGWSFENQNLVEVQAGALSFSTAGGVIDGTWNTSAGSGIQFQTGSYGYTADAKFMGAGQSQFTGSTLLLTGSLTPPNLKLAGGTILVAPGFQGGSITNLAIDGAKLDTTNSVTGTLTMNAGRLSGQLLIASGGQLQFLTTTAKFFENVALMNQGLVSWVAGGLNELAGSSRSIITNAGVWDMALGGELVYNGGKPLPRFINTGTFRKSAGAGAGQIAGWEFENESRVEVQSGALVFSSTGFRIDGTWSMAAGASVQFVSGTYEHTPEASFTGPGDGRFVGGTFVASGMNTPPNLKFNGGTVLLDPGFQGGRITELTIDGAKLETTNTVTGKLTLNSGRLGGKLGIAPGGQLELASNGSKFFDSLFLFNQGLVSWTGGGLAEGGFLSHSLVTNAGVWELAFDGTLSSGSVGEPPRFVNQGLFRKTGGTRTSVVRSWEFENQGTVDLRVGRFQFTQNIVVGPASRIRFSLAGKNSLTDFGVLQIDGTANLAGTLEVMFAGGFQPVPGDSFQIIDYIAAGTDFTTLAGEADQFEVLKEATRLRLRGRPGLAASRPPDITQQPVGRASAPGDTVILNIVATGSPAPSYQWRRNGQNLPGESSPQLEVIIKGPENAGSYTCVVYNEGGAVLSESAVVTVKADVLPFTDVFSTRGEINTLSGVGVSTNTSATREVGEPLHAGKDGNTSVWISYLATVTGALELSTFGSDFDTLLAVYTGSIVGALTPVIADDDDAGFYTSRARFSVVAGTRYGVAVDGRAGASGNLVFRWLLKPAEPAPPRILVPPKNQLAREGGTAVFSVSAADTQAFQWYKDGVALVDGGRVGGSTTSILTIAGILLEDVANYRVELRGNGTLLSSIAALQLNPAVPDEAALPMVGTRDKFSDFLDERNAGFLPGSERGAAPAGQARRNGLFRGVSGTVIFSTVGSSTEPGEPIPCGYLGGASQWFDYQADFDGVLTVDSAESRFDTVVAAYYNNCVLCSTTQEVLQALVPLACNNDASPLIPTSRMSFSVTNGSIYSVVVDGVNGASGIAKLTYAATRTPLTLTMPVRNADGRIQFRVNGGKGLMVRVDVSPDLRTFSPVLTNSIPNGGFVFTDSSPAPIGRYFRAVYP